MFLDSYYVILTIILIKFNIYTFNNTIHLKQPRIILQNINQLIYS